MADIDTAVERLETLMPKGMIDAILVSIKFRSGFEIMNTRPYKCYETWCRGWFVEDPWSIISAKADTLDDAIEAFCDQWENPPQYLEGRAARVVGTLPDWHPFGNPPEEA